MDTIWMRNPEDGLDCAASSPADVARLKSLGYVESDSAPGDANSQPPESRQINRREGIEKPAAS